MLWTERTLGGSGRKTDRPRATTLVIAFLCSLLLPAAPARAFGESDAPATEMVAPALPALRSERVTLACGAEVITVFGTADSATDVPLVAVLNDTLGDDDPANDRLRYVWVFSYCPPSVSQRILASIPFFYHGFSSRTPDRSSPPPVIFDFSRNPDPLWRKIGWYAMQAMVLDPHGWLFQAGSRTYTRNEREYRNAHLENGLSILEMYRESADADEVPDVIDGAAFAQVYGRIVESGLAGAFLNERHMADAYEKDSAASRRSIARNWELLRQRCEEEGLFFDPLPAPPARARHAIVWVSRDEIEQSPKNRPFDARFLNIKSPWSDASLRSWEGYSKIFYVDSDGRYGRERVDGARPVEMVPLSVYGLDFPKIPALLVDFRSVFNPKRRELSRRAIDDVGRYLLHVSPFGDVKLYVAQKVYGMITGRKGIDINQPSRALTYAQLKSLLVLRDELDPELRELVLRDVGRLNVNPLENDLETEREIALVQYRALVRQVESGRLDERVENDRDAERTKLAHGGIARAFLKTASIVSFGLYKHREDSPETHDRYVTSRALDHYSALLAEVAAAPRPIEVSWDPERFRPALDFVARNGSDGNAALVRSIEAIVRNSEDLSDQLLAIDALAGIDSATARRALERITTDTSLAANLRAHSKKRLDTAAGGVPSDDVATPLIP